MTLPPNNETVISPMHTACRIDFVTIMLFVLSLRMSIMDIAIITYWLDFPAVYYSLLLSYQQH